MDVQKGYSFDGILNTYKATLIGKGYRQKEGNEHKVCKLIKSLYELKQAPKKWYEKFDSKIMSNDFNHNSVDKCLYTKINDSMITLICLYVDDMLIISNNVDGIKETKRFLSSMFKTEDLG